MAGKTQAPEEGPHLPEQVLLIYWLQN